MQDDLGLAVELIRRARHLVAMTGAGISTPSGIPDFRSEGSGLWTLYDPMEVASIWAFTRRPEAFFEWVRPLTRMIREARPNPAHYALARLEAAGILKTLITQNIDELHQKAGSRNVIEVHGHLREATCIRCYRKVPAEPYLEAFLQDGTIPRCEQCGGVLKPDIVLFGEQLPARAFMAAQQEARRADVFLVAGSSLEVAPAGDLPILAKEHGARLIIVNLSPTAADRYADVRIHGDVAEVLPRLVDQVLG